MQVDFLTLGPSYKHLLRNNIYMSERQESAFRILFRSHRAFSRLRMATPVLLAPRELLMDRLNVLLGIAERRTGNLIEAAVLDACYEQALAEFTRTSRIDQLVLWGARGGFDLLVVGADLLLADPGRRAGWASSPEVIEAIRGVRARCSTPLLVLTNTIEDEELLLEAGARTVLPLPLQPEPFKAEVRRLLGLPEFAESSEPSRSRWFSAATLFRGFLG